MLAPRRTKYRKTFRAKTKEKNALKGTRISFGEFGLKAQTSGRVSSRQIEAARRAMTHFIKRGGRVWIRIFPDKVVTKKPPETRMGGGKGDVHEYVAQVQTGRIVFEMAGITEEVAREALRLASNKLSIRSAFTKKGDMLG